MKKYNYVITSGWWCDNDQSTDRDIKYGSSEQRQVKFFNLWYESINKSADPNLIVVVDSASPVKPDCKACDKLYWVNLRQNPGHSTIHLGQYSGYSQGVITGMLHALLEDVDYWVYIEQDALIAGNGIIEYAISKMRGRMMFGCGRGTPQPLQQSFMIFKKDAIRRFINNFFKIRYRDNQVSPEIKFAVASSPLLSLFPNAVCWFLSKRNRFGKLMRKAFCLFARSRLRGWESLPFGYGRARPIDFDDEYYYFQHGSEEEIHAFKTKFYAGMTDTE